jgi:hypothetical protein
MYEFPQENDLRQLVGQTVIQVCCTINQITFHFGMKTSISACSTFLHKDHLGQAHEITVPVSTASVFVLLECQVVNIARGEGGFDLTLSFSNGHMLSFSSYDSYESVSLRINDKVWIV